MKLHMYFYDGDLPYNTVCECIVHQKRMRELFLYMVYGRCGLLLGPIQWTTTFDLQAGSQYDTCSVGDCEHMNRLGCSCVRSCVVSLQ